MQANNTVSPQQIEVVLLAESSVQECSVQLRQCPAGAVEAVIYIVPRGQHAWLALQQQLTSLLERAEITIVCHYVLLAYMPLTHTGEVDQAVLENLPVVDTELATNLTRRLNAFSKIDQAAVVIDDYILPRPALHLSDVLPDWGGDENTVVASASNNTVVENSASYLSIRTGVAALSVGAELVIDAEMPRLLADALERAAARYPEHGLVYVQSDGSEISQSYPELLVDARAIASGLVQQGLLPGERVIFQLAAGQDFIPAFWGCVLAGCVPVPVATAHQYRLNDPAVEKLAKAWQMLHKPVVLASGQIAPQLELLATEAELHGLSALSITALRDSAAASVSTAAIHRGAGDDPVVILLTSGSTGLPKGVVLSHSNLITMALGSAQQNNFTHQDVTLNWMPLEHVGAVSFLQTMAVVLGCRQVHAPTDYVLQKPLRWLDLIEQHRASITWGPNFAFGLLNDLAASIAKRRWDLSSMRFMVSAAEQIVAKTVRQFLQMLAPQGLASDSIHPAFGMSETCSGITWSSRFSLETTTDQLRYVELGAPIPGASVRIVNSANQILDEGEIGRMQLKGPSVTAGYFENPERNSAAFTDDGWFDTGDLGFLYEGRLTLTGREKEEIIINGINYAGAEIEASVEAVAGIELSYTAAVAVHTDDSESDRLAIFFVPNAQDDVDLLDMLSAVRQQLGESVGITPAFLIPLSKNDIPKTDIGKIQRKQLRQRFDAGDYADIIKHIDIISENANTLPDWFMQRCWLPKQGVHVLTAERSGTILAFIDDAAQASVLRTRLADHCARLICVEPGAAYRQLDDDLYQVSIDDVASVKKLFVILETSAPALKQVLHFWSCASTNDESVLPTQSATAKRSIFSLLCLLQALDHYHAQHSYDISLFVFSSGAQLINDSDTLDISKSALGGLLKTAAREFSWLHCRHVDLAAPDYTTQSDVVLQEISIAAADQEVAWRDGQRLVMALAQADMSTAQTSALPFVPGGLYIISGGLGALGIQVARYLLNNFAARLLLLGRSEKLDAQRGDTLLALQQLAGEVSYHAVDICDREAMVAIVAQAESAGACRLAGVIHLAGLFHQAALSDETPDTMRVALAAKMDGSLVLHQLLEQRGAGVFISFGSVNGFFGGAEFAAYSAGNSFLSGFSQWQNQQTPIRAWCLEWSMWDEMGISQGFAAKAASRAQGFHALSAEQGMLAFRIGLHHAVHQLLIGLDPGRSTIRRQIIASHPECEWLQAYVTCLTDSNTIAADIREQIPLNDRFDRPLDYRLSVLDEMPLLDSGEPDKDRLYQLHGQHKAGENNRVAPSTVFERRIATIWQDVLGIGEISIHDNFFALGGDSLKGAQVMNRLQEDTGVIMHVVALFNAPTVAELAVHLAEHYTDSSEAAEQITVADEARLRAMIHPLAARTSSATPGKRRAIFVLSPPRAGSTLLRVMLGGHPQLFAPPELYLLSFNDLAEWRETFSGEQTFWHEGMVRALMEIRQVDTEAAEAIIDEHVSQGASSHAFFEHMQSWLGERMLVDKTPTYALDLEVLRRIEQDFDEVHYIHLQRHPYGVIRSFDEARLDQLLYAFMPNLRSDDEQQSFTRKQLAELVWLICNRNILEFLREIPQQRQHAVRFEDIVRQPESSIRQICEFLDIQYDAAMLQPYDKRRARMTEGLHEQSRMLGDLKFHHHKKIDDSVADSWKREFSSDFLGDITWEIAHQFGYMSIKDEAKQAKSQATNVIEKTLSEEEELLARLDGMSDEEIERELEKMLVGKNGD